jgi:hypothetical protein
LFALSRQPVQQWPVLVLSQIPLELPTRQESPTSARQVPALLQILHTPPPHGSPTSVQRASVSSPTGSLVLSPPPPLPHAPTGSTQSTASHQTLRTTTPISDPEFIAKGS